MRTILCLPFISVIEKMSSDKKKEQNKSNNNNIDKVKCTNIVKHASAVNEVDLVKQDTIKKLIFLSGLEDNALWYDESSYYGNSTTKFTNLFTQETKHYDACFDNFHH